MIKNLLENVYFGTIRQIAEDLITQIDDYESFHNGKEVELDELKRVSSLLELVKETLLVYCGEGGIPLESTKFENFTRKHFPEILNYKKIN